MKNDIFFEKIKTPFSQINPSKEQQKEELLKNMDLAIRQDRDRFFKITDTLHLQPKYKERLNELELIKQQWRDITNLPDYPNITHPLLLPDWFPVVHFASSFEKDVYINEQSGLIEN